MFVRSWNHMTWEERKSLVLCLKGHIPFNSRVVYNGGLFGDSSLNGTYIAQGKCNELCRECGEYRAYEVWSYKLLVYSICEKCGYEIMYPQTWEHEGSRDTVNSRMTSILQSIIMDAFPSYKQKRGEYLNNVQRARKWLTTERREKYGIEGKLTDEQALGVYERFYARLREQLAK